MICDFEGLEFKYVEQRNGGLEAQVGYNNREWIRLDAFLEHCLVKSFDITKAYKGELGNGPVDREYQNKILEHSQLDFSKKNY